MEQTPTQPISTLDYAKAKKKQIIIVTLVVLLGASYVYQVQTNQRLKSQNQRLINHTLDSKSQASASAAALTQEVGRLLALPTNETPTVATVVDPAKLQNQAFFAHAQAGDKVLMYSQAKEAVLYRPSLKKIIETAPLNTGTPR